MTNLKSDLTDQQSLTIMSFISGKNYSLAAQTILSSDNYLERRYQLLLPVNMLIGHSLECYLKSILYKGGLSEADIRRDFGHDLVKLHPEATKHGMELSDKFYALMALHAKGHSKETDYAFRYPKRGAEFFDMKPDVLIENLKIIDSEFGLFINPEEYLSP
ncbi:hypothetical protein [Gluconobacter albidus]|uniref:hypothetical protein n=1 Tax=Gluconobacter albidus TaxID=318683 RepID=UPI0012E94CF6|nr:hypothetical protein [Gluconobacter albidus]